MELSLEKRLVLKELQKDIELELNGHPDAGPSMGTSSVKGKAGYNLVEVEVHPEAGEPYKSRRWMKEGEALPAGAKIIKPAAPVVRAGLRLFDEGPGKAIDRYTLITSDGSVYGFNDNPFDPNGFGQYAGDYGNKLETYAHLGKPIKIGDLPPEAQKYVRIVAEDEIQPIAKPKEPPILEDEKRMQLLRGGPKPEPEMVRDPNRRERVMIPKPVEVPKPAPSLGVAPVDPGQDRLDKILLGKAIGAYRKGDVDGLKSGMSERQLWHALRGAESGMAKWKDAAARGEAKAVESYSGYEIMHKVIGGILGVGGILGIKSAIKKEVDLEKALELRKLEMKVPPRNLPIKRKEPEGEMAKPGGERQWDPEFSMEDWGKYVIGEDRRNPTGAMAKPGGEKIVKGAYTAFPPIPDAKAFNPGGRYGTCKSCWGERMALDENGLCGKCRTPEEEKRPVNKPLSGLDANNPKGIYPEQSL